MANELSADPAANGRMPTTAWTLVARLNSGDTEQARVALDELCRSYHYPLYCQIRRRGLDHHDAEDALHDFLAKLMRNDSFGVADRDKGRLRTFLGMALQRFLSNWRRDQRSEQGREVSGEAMAAIAEAEGRFEHDEAAHHESPDRLYDRQWARELMRQVMQHLRARYEVKGRAMLFDTLCPVLLSGGSLTDHDSAQIAERLNMRPGALRMALMRLLRDYHEALRHEIHQTVEDKEMAREELQSLAVLFGPQ